MPNVPFDIALRNCHLDIEEPMPEEIASYIAEHGDDYSPMDEDIARNHLICNAVYDEVRFLIQSGRLGLHPVSCAEWGCNFVKFNESGF